MAFGGMQITYQPESAKQSDIMAAIANGREVTTATTLLATDTTVKFTSASPISNQTLPASQTGFTPYKSIDLVNGGSAVVTITSSLSGTTGRTIAPGGSYTIFPDGTSWFIK